MQGRRSRERGEASRKTGKLTHSLPFSRASSFDVDAGGPECTFIK